jgi:hypothetical protein
MNDQTKVNETNRAEGQSRLNAGLGLTAKLRAYINDNGDWKAGLLPEDIIAAVDEIERLRDALMEIKDMTNVEDDESYRCDDREGCLDAVFATATDAL